MIDKPSESVAAPVAGSAAEQCSGQNSVAATQQSPGELLAAGRQANELTVDEVGDALNLAPTTVRYLEADNYQQLPAAAFTQGYIRNYAKHVGLDADMVVSAYQNKAGKPDVEWQSPRSAAGIAELVQRYPGVLISAVVAGVVLLLVLTLILVWPEEDTPPDASDSATIEQTAFSVASDEPVDSAPTTSPTTASDSAVAGPADGGSGVGDIASRRFDAPRDPATTSAGDFARDAIDPNDPLAHLPLAKTYPAESRDDSAPTRPKTGTSAPSQSAAEDLSNYPLTVTRRLTPQGDDQIRVEVSEDCWVAISSATGDSLFGILARPGQTLNLTGAGPFRVKLGYTPGIALFFNDEPVLLEPYTRNDVASLVIGQ